MTILSIAQTCSRRLQIPVPVSFIGNTSNDQVFLKAMIEKAVGEIKDDFPWPELEREYTFTLATSTASYALPGDYDARQNVTVWNRTQHWPLIGPVDAVEWQIYKSGNIVTLPRQRFRVKGSAISQFFIDPTPTSSENGQTCVYEYISTNAFRPKTWVASTSWLAIQYCFYDGNYYDRGAVTAATTGTTPPTHTSGSVSDGGVTWTYINTPYSLVSDTDEILLNNDSIIDGAIWRFKMERGMDYNDLRKIAEDQLEIAKSKLIGAGVLTINRVGRGVPMIGPWSYPEGSFGV